MSHKTTGTLIKYLNIFDHTFAYMAVDISTQAVSKMLVTLS